MNFFSRRYDELSHFLHAMRRHVSFILPYNEKFKRSYVRIGLVVPLILVTLLPSVPFVYRDSNLDLTLLLLQYIEIVLVFFSLLFCYSSTIYNVSGVETIHQRLLFSHKLYQQARELTYSSKWIVAFDVITIVESIAVTISLAMGPAANISGTSPLQILTRFGSMSYSLPMIIMHFLGSSYRIYLYIVLVQLTNLNKSLYSLKVFRPSQYEKLVCGHSLLTRTFYDLNAAYSSSVFLLVACTFFVIVYNIYDMLSFNLEGNIRDSLSDNVSGACWVIFWITELIVLVVLTEKVAEKHSQFNYNLHFIIISDSTGILSRSPKLLAHVARNDKLEFSAAGFFAVDYKLVASIASSATTYLIILIQFAQLNGANKNKSTNGTAAVPQ